MTTVAFFNCLHPHGEQVGREGPSLLHGRDDLHPAGDSTLFLPTPLKRLFGTESVVRGMKCIQNICRTSRMHTPGSGKVNMTCLAATKDTSALDSQLFNAVHDG